MIIGLTGSMASGKSTVSEFLKKRGLHIIDADKAAHKILFEDETKKSLAECFGNDIIGSDGEIDRKNLAEKAFSSEEATEKLNSITHPAIISLIREDIKENEKKYPAVVIDAPLLIEAGLHKICDAVWLVCANIETRYARIMKRDNLTRAQARARVAKQIPQWKKKRFADALIDNDGTVAALESRIDTLLAQYGLTGK